MQHESKKQLLEIDPQNEIVFKGPYTSVVTKYLLLTNPSTDKTVAFKVKTTAPKRYCVRPNNGIIQPECSVNVAVMLQPGDLSQEKNKHKFLIQSAIITNTTANLEDFFKSLPPDEIMDSKFKCVFADLGTSGSSPVASRQRRISNKKETDETSDANSNRTSKYSSGNEDSNSNEGGQNLTSATNGVDGDILWMNYGSDFSTKTSASTSSTSPNINESNNNKNSHESTVTSSSATTIQRGESCPDLELKAAQALIRDLTEQLRKYQNSKSTQNVMQANSNDLTQFGIILAVVCLIVGIIIGVYMV